ncbi:ROK family transcriptional regulator [Streptomyces sp. DSM 44915]|uniref:ROK family transcriptional regulator n=1 Tax=Streptomyces chisholmiae TaxID=3075540 RepID=A0ABU2JYZ1_9ACTN|nr:ROK family transcriptional regulator [Streptomyces sp. DSM 44915]MDT0270220.1 ROK family transcriptional regulator [Streptomyces sp. DSM 44915]
MTDDRRGPRPHRPAGRPALDLWGTVTPAARPVVRELLVNGPGTRTDLARTLGLSGGSLTRLTKPLVEAGLVAERSVVHDPDNGRPTRPLDIAGDGHRFLGVKLTADHLYAVVTDLRATVLAERAEPLAGRTPEAVCAQARRLLDEMGPDGPPEAAGVSLGGHPRPAGGAGPDGTAEQLCDAPFLGWRDVPLARLFRRTTGLPTVVDNDVAALAHAQHWFGAARGHRDFALVTVGAGIGYALFLDGRMRPLSALDLNGFSHHVLDPGGPLCPDGHRGCLAAHLSTQSLLAAAAQGLRRRVTLREVTELAVAGDPICRSVAGSAAWALGAVAGTIANLTGVRTVIAAGEGVELVGAARAALADGIRQRRHRDHHTLEVSLGPDSFTEWARGAAVTAIRAFVVRDPA